MRRRTTVRIICVVLLAAACGERPIPPAQSPAVTAAPPVAAASSARPDSLACPVDLAWDLLETDGTRADMDSILGAPDSTSWTTEPNRHTDGVVDSLWVVHYPGLTSSIRVANGTDFPETIVVTKSGYVRTPPLGVDIAVSDSTILRILGRPAEQDSAHLVYVCSDGAEEPVTFELTNGRVSKISIERYVD